MSYSVPDPVDRADIIAYLVEQRGNPVAVRNSGERLRGVATGVPSTGEPERRAA